jgi:hypothetical protein
MLLSARKLVVLGVTTTVVTGSLIITTQASQAADRNAPHPKVSLRPKSPSRTSGTPKPLKGAEARERFEQLLDTTEGVRDLGTLMGERGGQLRLYSVVKANDFVIYVDQDELGSPGVAHAFFHDDAALNFWTTLRSPVFEPAETTPTL